MPAPHGNKLGDDLDRKRIGRGLRAVNLEAINWLQDYGTGDTRPQLFECSRRGRRSERWVLKLMGKADRELVSDWIGSLLAHRLKLHTPEVAVVEVTAEALRTAPQNIQSWARPGPAFASREIAAASPITSSGDLISFGSPEELGAMYALDSWLDVVDRRKPDGVWNLLLDTSVSQLNVLDFGKGLSSYMFIMFGAQRTCDPLYPSSVMFAASMEAALVTCDAIERISEVDLTDMVCSAPATWLTETERAGIVPFLLERLGCARAACEQLGKVKPPWA
ncbi:MAG: HipA family kinase [Dehalococcoidia bacterium]